MPDMRLCTFSWTKSLNSWNIWKNQVYVAHFKCCLMIFEAMRERVKLMKKIHIPQFWIWLVSFILISFSPRIFEAHINHYICSLVWPKFLWLYCLLPLWYCRYHHHEQIGTDLRNGRNGPKYLFPSMSSLSNDDRKDQVMIERKALSFSFLEAWGQWQWGLTMLMMIKVTSWAWWCWPSI